MIKVIVLIGKLFIVFYKDKIVVIVFLVLGWVNYWVGWLLIYLSFIVVNDGCIEYLSGFYNF